MRARVCNLRKRRSSFVRKGRTRRVQRGQQGVRLMGLVATTSPPPPLAAKPPLLPPPPFKPYTLDGAFDTVNLGRGSPQQTQQQWQNNGVTPSSRPPPPVPNRNSYASPLQQPPAPYGISSPASGPSPCTQYPTHKPTVPPPHSPFLSSSSYSTFVC